MYLFVSASHFSLFQRQKLFSLLMKACNIFSRTTLSYLHNVNFIPANWFTDFPTYRPPYRPTDCPIDSDILCAVVAHLMHSPQSVFKPTYRLFIWPKVLQTCISRHTQIIIIGVIDTTQHNTIRQKDTIHGHRCQGPWGTERQSCSRQTDISPRPSLSRTLRDRALDHSY